MPFPIRAQDPNHRGRVEQETVDCNLTVRLPRLDHVEIASNLTLREPEHISLLAPVPGLVPLIPLGEQYLEGRCIICSRVIVPR
jgi:hypothetical protein